MSLPAVTSRQEWLAARKELLVREKELTKLHDALNTSRRQVPMVRIDKEYVFEGHDGKARLTDMFGPNGQLVLQHVMFDPAWDDACPSCSAGLDELSQGLLRNLRARDTAFAALARAPQAKIAAYKARKGWDFAWYSSFGSDFNYDFHVSIDASVAAVMFNYRDEAELKEAGLTRILDGASEQPGVSCFLRDGDAVFHTYSTFGRGTEHLGCACGTGQAGGRTTSAALGLHRAVEGAALAVAGSVAVIAALVLHAAGEGFALAALLRGERPGRAAALLAITCVSPAAGAAVLSRVPPPAAVAPVLTCLVARGLLRTALAALQLPA